MNYNGTNNRINCRIGADGGTDTKSTKSRKKGEKTMTTEEIRTLNRLLNAITTTETEIYNSLMELRETVFEDFTKFVQDEKEGNNEI